MGETQRLEYARGYVLGRVAALAARARELRALGVRHGADSSEVRDVALLAEIAGVLGIGLEFERAAATLAADVEAVRGEVAHAAE